MKLNLLILYHINIKFEYVRLFSNAYLFQICTCKEFMISNNQSIQRFNRSPNINHSTL